MDDTIADESGIPVLANSDDIPVHSTPIKGTKIPLPSTRHVMKALQEKGKPSTLSEQEISALPTIPDEGSSSNKRNLAEGLKSRLYASQDDRRQHSKNHVDTERKHSNTLRDHYKSLEDDTLLAFKQSLQRSNGLRDGKSEDKNGTHYHIKSAADSNTRPNYSSQRINKYDREDNLRSHTHSKHSKSHSDVPMQSYSSKSPDRTPPRMNSEAVSDKLNNKQLPLTKPYSSPDRNANAFSSYAFNTKESRSRSHRHSNRRLAFTPESNRADEVDNDGSPELTIVTKARLTQNPADVSPVPARRMDGAGERSGTGLKALSSSVKQASYSEMETSTIQKQRQEIQLLVTELKDRDRELGDMLKSHEQQLVAWEQDRQRLMVLDRKCVQYEADLHDKSSQLHNAHGALKALKSKHAALLEEAEGNQATVARLIGEINQLKEQIKQYEDKCGMLQKTVQELSNNVGRLQAREEELNTSLRLKEKDIISATSQMKELSDRLRHLDTRCKESQDCAKEAVKEKNIWKQKYDDAAPELRSLRDALAGKSQQIMQLEEEVQALRHHLAVLQKDAGMREKCQNEVIESMREKQERTDSQLKKFRELYDRQLQELSKLQLQLDTSKDIIKKQHSLEEQHLSGSYRGSSRLSDRSLDRNRSNVQTSRYRDTDTEVHSSQQHTQSSGYQTQISGNQSEFLEAQSVPGTHLQFQPNRITHTQDQPIGHQTSNDYAKFSNVNIHSNVFDRKDRNYTEDQSHLKPEISPKYVRFKLGDGKYSVQTFETNAKRTVSDGAIGDQKKSPQREDRSHSELAKLDKLHPNIDNGSPLQQGDCIINQPDTKAVIHEQVVEQKNVGKDTSEMGRADCILTQEIRVHNRETEQTIGAYVFENRLCSFLEDIDDIDDNIWDEKGNLSTVIPGVEASPASKLQKLLLESKMMIQSLERTAESPTSKQGSKTESKETQNQQPGTEK